MQLLAQIQWLIRRLVAMAVVEVAELLILLAAKVVIQELELRQVALEALQYGVQLVVQVGKLAVRMVVEVVDFLGPQLLFQKHRMRVGQEL